MTLGIGVRRIGTLLASRPGWPPPQLRQTCASGSPKTRTCWIPRSRAPSSRNRLFRAVRQAVDIDEKLNIVPQLATGYEWSADSKR